VRAGTGRDPGPERRAHPKFEISDAELADFVMSLLR